MAEPREFSPELRRGPQDDWVLLAPARSARPDETEEPLIGCPFCPGNEHLTPPSILTLPDAGADSAWSVRVVENRFPLLARNLKQVTSTRSPLLEAIPAVGVHEVVIETPHHDQEMALRKPEELVLTLAAWQHRVRTLNARRDLRHIVIFKNRGKEAGASLDHPHSQIVALTRTPRAVLQRSRRARAYFEESGSCAVCQASRRELELGSRVILEGNGFLAYAPFASFSNARVRITSLEHPSAFAEASPAALLDLSRALRRLLWILDTAFDSPAFNLILVMPPRYGLHHPSQHWYVDLIPRITQPGGFELATGLGVNTLMPEEAAQTYRQAGKTSLED